MSFWARQLDDYACPECGHRGPHASRRDEAGVEFAQCGNVECREDFEVLWGTQHC